MESKSSIVVAIGLFGFVLLLTGCVAHCPCDGEDAQFPASIRHQEQWIDPPTEKGKTIYVFRPSTPVVVAPPVLLLHEYGRVVSGDVILALDHGKWQEIDLPKSGHPRHMIHPQDRGKLLGAKTIS